MNSLPKTTTNRLKKIPQNPNVWEGDRRPIAGMMKNLEADLQDNGECIIWVDASEGLVRSMEVVRHDVGPEAMVRALLKAIEDPHNPAEPARPQKIVVCDREIQFFLRGALQNLEITVDYVPQLVLIDELWRNFADINQTSEQEISSELEDLLDEVAEDIWYQEPWELLTDHDIIKIQVNLPDIDNIYACIMGMLGEEYGIILYRSLDSLKNFRNAAFKADEEALDNELERVFLQQDCWFVNYAPIDENELDMNDLDVDDVQSLFGSIHPYEGMRPLRDENEALPIYLALEGLKRFVDECEDELNLEQINHLSANYKIDISSESKPFNINISTMPELAQELMEMLEEAEREAEEQLSNETFFLKDNLIPPGSILSLTSMSWELLDFLNQKQRTFFDGLDTTILESLKEKNNPFPVILIQTTRPKAKILIQQLQAEGGLEGISFNPGVDLYDEVSYDLGILQTPQNNLYIFAQFAKQDESKLSQLVHQWQKKVKKLNNHCGLLIAMGATGSSRSNPQFKDMMGFFPTTLKSSKELGLGTLTLEK